MEYHFKYAFTEEEYLEFNIYTIWGAPWQKKYRLWYLVRQALVGFAIIAGFHWINKDWTITMSDLIVLAIFIPLIIVITLLTVHSGIRRRARALVQKEENRHMLEENELILNDEGIENADSRSTTKMRWNSIIRYANAPNAFYLYINSQLGFIVPKRLFRDEASADEFDKFITHHVPLSSSFRSMK